MFGLAIYAGEGSKTGGAVTITNCDPKLLRCVVEFFKMLGVDIARMRGAIQVHSDERVAPAEKYWSEELGIPPAQFQRTHVVVTRSSKRIRGNVQPNGTCRVKVNDTRLLRMVLRWIERATEQRTES